MSPSSMFCLPAIDQRGNSVTIPIGEILGLAPDEDCHDGTILFLADGTAQVDEEYESLIDRIAGCWRPAH
jgi:hypothetical protein